MALIAQLVGVGGATLVKINWTLFTSVSRSLKIPIAFDPIILRLRNSSKPTKYLLRHHETFKLIRQPGSPPCLPRGHSGGTYLLAQWLQVLFNRRPHSGPHSSLHRCPEKGFLAFLPFPLPDPPAPRVQLRCKEVKSTQNKYENHPGFETSCPTGLSLVTTLQARDMPMRSHCTQGSSKSYFPQVFMVPSLSAAVSQLKATFT